MAILLPLSDFRTISTTDPEVALHGMQQRQPCCREIRPLVKRDWKLVSNAYALGSVTLVSSASQGYSVEVHPDQRVRVFMPLSGNMSLQFRGAEFHDLGRAEGFFLNHGFGVTTFHPGNELVLLTATAEGVAKYLRLIDVDVDPTVVADRLAGDPSAPGLGRLRRAVMHCIWEIEEGFPDLASQALFRNQTEQMLLLRLASIIGDLTRNERHQCSVHARTLRRAMDYVRNTPADAFSYADLASHVGASLRSVQMAFRTQLNTTIREWVRDHRLDMARDALRQGLEGGSVTRVALLCGFPHAGRFSSVYFARFGEYPSQTARR